MEADGAEIGGWGLGAACCLGSFGAEATGAALASAAPLVRAGWAQGPNKQRRVVCTGPSKFHFQRMSAGRHDEE